MCDGGGDEKGRERACANSPLTPVGVGAGVGCDVQLLHIYAESGGTKELLIRKHRNTNTKRDDTGFVETRSLSVFGNLYNAMRTQAQCPANQVDWKGARH